MSSYVRELKTCNKNKYIYINTDIDDIIETLKISLKHHEEYHIFVDTANRMRIKLLNIRDFLRKRRKHLIQFMIEVNVLKNKLQEMETRMIMILY